MLPSPCSAMMVGKHAAAGSRAAVCRRCAADLAHLHALRAAPERLQAVRTSVRQRAAPTVKHAPAYRIRNTRPSASVGTFCGSKAIMASFHFIASTDFRPRIGGCSGIQRMQPAMMHPGPPLPSPVSQNSAGTAWHCNGRRQKRQVQARGGLPGVNPVH